MFTSSGPKQCVIKERFVKHYRHPVLDANLSGQRLRAEARLLLHCRKLGIDVPPVLLVDIPTRRLWLGHIGPDAQTLSAWFASLASTCPSEESDNSHGDRPDLTAFQIAGARLTKLTVALGRLLARLHANHVTHGDLTMANILVRKATSEEERGETEPRLVLIDFGLASAISHSATQRLPEEKAVDLYVFERALINALDLSFLERIGHTFPQFATPETVMNCVLEAYCIHYPAEATPLRREADEGSKKTNGTKNPQDSFAALQAEVKSNVSKLDEVRLRGRKRLMLG
ncbi:unnamed protein product [Echinostoma caproni]|uniref:non-specific serine/threonine protein kinase n=1 Tax=Echinostoma caproni TaxID=27848 RepID=A0A3P8LDA2_9TREM|nr:unnamed protein product [Echinostoma caproni]